MDHIRERPGYNLVSFETTLSQIQAKKGNGKNHYYNISMKCSLLAYYCTYFNDNWLLCLLSFLIWTTFDYSHYISALISLFPYYPFALLYAPL